MYGSDAPAIIALSEFERKRNELTRKKEALRIQRTQLETTVVQRIELSSVAAAIEEFCAQVRPVLEKATFAQRRQLVELPIDRVVIAEDRVESRYVTPTQPEGPLLPFSQLCIDYPVTFYVSEYLILTVTVSCDTIHLFRKAQGRC